VLGLKGTYKSWDWEVYGSWSEIDIEEDQLNNVLSTTALATINDRSYNFLNPFANPASVTERLRYNGFKTGNSRFDDYGARASGEVWNLPAGPMLAAVGVQYTTLEVEDNPDPQIAAGNALGISASAAFGRQDLVAVYGEVIVPVIKGLEISGALRYDKYSESGDFSNTSPKVGVRWQPTKNFLFRTTYSEAFRAPSIFEATSATQSSFEFGLYDPTRCPDPTAPAANANPNCNLDVKIIQTGNPNLKPEESKIFNVGVVWEPINNLTMSLDYWKVDRDDEISLFATQTLINLFPNNPAIVVRDATGLIDQVNNVPVQLSGTKTSGWDFDVRARIPTDGWGTFSPRLVVSYIDEYTFKTIGDSGQIEDFNYNGTYNQPRLRGSWDLAWQYGAHELSLNGYYVHSFDQLNPIASGADVDSAAVWNLFWKWNFAKNWSLNASVVNLFDEDPPFSNESSASNAGYNPSQHDPRGRYYQLGITYRFK
jgi:iron complex outermembrane recepter protein